MKFARATILALAAAAATPALAHQHHERHLSCELHSDYSLSLAPDTLRFERDDKSRRVELRQGQLLVDGKAVALSAADKEKLQRFEQELRALMPEVRAIALEAVDIAYTAVSHVMKTFASDAASAERSLARLESDRKAMRAKIESQAGAPWFDEHAFEKLVESTVATVVPEIVGDVTAAAVKAALSGDEHAVEEIERKAERMEKEIERDVEARADVLEKRADQLCPRLTELDRIESSLELRLADGRPLNLLETRH